MFGLNFKTFTCSVLDAGRVLKLMVTVIIESSKYCSGVVHETASKFL